MPSPTLGWLIRRVMPWAAFWGLAIEIDDDSEPPAADIVLRNMRRMEASFKNARALRLRFSQSLARRRQRLSQAIVRSTTAPGRIRPPPLNPKDSADSRSFETDT